MNAEVQEKVLMTPTQILDYSETLISRRFPNEVVKFYGRQIPAYEWSGAGSEKGGSSGHLFFEKLIFAPLKENEEKSLVISVGRREGSIDHSRIPVIDYGGNISWPYSPQSYGVFRIIVPTEFTKEILEKYDSFRNDSLSFGDKNYWQSPRRKLDYAISELIRKNNHHYSGISLFVFDGKIEGLRKGFFHKRHLPLDGSLDDVLETTDFGAGFLQSSYERERGIEIANELADRLLVPSNFSSYDLLNDFGPLLTEEEIEEKRKSPLFLPYYESVQLIEFLENIQ